MGSQYTIAFKSFAPNNSGVVSLSYICYCAIFCGNSVSSIRIIVGRRAYYWLRMAEHNAERILAQTRRALEDVRRSVDAETLQEVDRSLQSDGGRSTNASRLLAVSKLKRFSVVKKAAS